MIEELVNQNFTYVPSTSTPRQIRLKSDKTVDDFKIKRFTLNQVGMPTLVFLDEAGNFVSRLQWENNVFRGRDSTGPVELRVSNPKLISKLLTEERVVRLHGEVPPPPQQQRINLQRKLNLQKLTGDTAVALVAFNRPAYFEEVLKALSPQVQQKPVYAFLDRPVEDGQIGMQKIQSDMVLKYIPNAVIVNREVNYGCGLNIIDVREQLFSMYEKVFVFEDDMVPSKNYVEYCEKLLEWATEEYSNVGAVQGWARCFLSESSKKTQNSKIQITYDNAWGYLMTRECWEAMRPRFFDYVSFLDDRRYEQRDNMKISRWQANFKQMNFSPKGEKSVPMDKVSSLAERNMLDGLPTGQDGTTYLLMRNAGYVRLASVVNRGLYIGKTGIHSNPDLFYKSQFEKMSLDELPVPKSFKLKG
jgi:hypothetical protein